MSDNGNAVARYVAKIFKKSLSKSKENSSQNIYQRKIEHSALHGIFRECEITRKTNFSTSLET